MRGSGKVILVTGEILSRVIGREVRLAPRAGGGPSGDEMKAMQAFFDGKACAADIPAPRKIYPGLHTFDGWLRETGWEHLPVLPLPAAGAWGRS